MATDVISLTAFNAMNGLYLTSDLFISAQINTHPILTEHVDMLHATQAHSADFNELGDLLSDLNYMRSVEAPAAETINGSLFHWRSNAKSASFGQIVMMSADLTLTYSQIRRSMLAAAALAFSIILHNRGVADDGLYPRTIPPTLADMQINDVTPAVFWRIFTTEPWLSWMERLRAQKQRTDHVLATDFIPTITEGVKKLFAAVAYMRKKEKALYFWNEDVRAKKSIRKAYKLFDRMDRLSDLQIFMARTDLCVQGCAYDYHLTRHAEENLFEATIKCNAKTSPMHVVLYNKAGDRLCSLCLFFKDTPILDMILAIQLNVQNAQTELEMLKAACIGDVTSAFFADPLLPSLKAFQHPSEVPMLIDNILKYAWTLPDTLLIEKTAFMTNALPIAYKTFVQIMRLKKRYLPIMHLCQSTDPWIYMHPGTASGRLTQVQVAYDAGTF